jgi:2-amino-4-hydroxy-6-hydroxymethyldihydropteridine diphosphokinase
LSIRRGEIGPVPTVFLSLGSNLGDRLANLRDARRRLERKVRIDKVSSVYDTDPVGYEDQPPFLDAVVQGWTDLEPMPLLDFVKDIEEEMGRVPTLHWGPRLIDIDILTYGRHRIETLHLIVPHPEMRKRAFVLVPLAEIAPHFIIPGAATGAVDLAARAPGLDGIRVFGTLDEEGR